MLRLCLSHSDSTVPPQTPQTPEMDTLLSEPITLFCTRQLQSIPWEILSASPDVPLVRGLCMSAFCCQLYSPSGIAVLSHERGPRNIPKDSALSRVDVELPDSNGSSGVSIAGKLSKGIGSGMADESAGRRQQWNTAGSVLPSASSNHFSSTGKPATGAAKLPVDRFSSRPLPQANDIRELSDLPLFKASTAQSPRNLLRFIIKGSIGPDRQQQPLFVAFGHEILCGGGGGDTSLSPSTSLASHRRLLSDLKLEDLLHRRSCAMLHALHELCIESDGEVLRPPLNRILVYNHSSISPSPLPRTPPAAESPLDKSLSSLKLSSGKKPSFLPLTHSLDCRRLYRQLLQQTQTSCRRSRASS